VRRREELNESTQAKTSKWNTCAKTKTVLITV